MQRDHRVSKKAVKTEVKHSDGSLSSDRPIKITGARVHNLKNIDVEIPRNSQRSDLV